MGTLALWWFDLTRGFPASLGVLRRRLGLWRFLRLLGAFMRRRITSRPFASLGAPATPAERFTRHQLEPVLLLDAVMTRDLNMPSEETRAVLLEVVGEAGARFVLHQVRHPTAQVWAQKSEDERRALAHKMFAPFKNAEMHLVEVGERTLGFDVTRCHFVSLTQRLGRPDLAALFCHADSVAYGDPSVPVSLQRDSTLATGGARCTFRYAFRGP